MLVLSRQRDETIMIGDDIEITVVDVRGDKVRLGITAPTRIAVHRKEVYDAIRAENQRAAQIGNGDLSAVRAALASPMRPRVARCGSTQRSLSSNLPEANPGRGDVASSEARVRAGAIASLKSPVPSPLSTHTTHSATPTQSAPPLPPMRSGSTG
jgi:carbon storage regulator